MHSNLSNLKANVESIVCRDSSVVPGLVKTLFFLLLLQHCKVAHPCIILAAWRLLRWLSTDFYFRLKAHPVMLG